MRAAYLILCIAVTVSFLEAKKLSETEKQLKAAANQKKEHAHWLSLYKSAGAGGSEGQDKAEYKPVVSSTDGAPSVEVKQPSAEFKEKEDQQKKANAKDESGKIIWRAESHGDNVNVPSSYAGDKEDEKGAEPEAQAKGTKQAADNPTKATTEEAPVGSNAPKSASKSPSKLKKKHLHRKKSTVTATKKEDVSIKAASSAEVNLDGKDKDKENKDCCPPPPPPCPPPPPPCPAPSPAPCPPPPPPCPPVCPQPPPPMETTEVETQKKKVDEKTNVTIKAGKDAKEEKEKDDKEDCPDKKSAKCKK